MGTPSLVGCLVAAVAARDATPLWTLDLDLEPLAQAGVIVRFEA